MDFLDTGKPGVRHDLAAEQQEALDWSQVY